MIEAFLFDLDGTLVTMEFDVVVLRKTIAGIFAHYGVVDYTFSKPLLESLAEVEATLRARGKETSSLRGEVMDLIEEKEGEGTLKTRPIEGARELLVYLKRKGMQIGVVTRTNRKSALVSLARCGIDSAIDLLLARDDVPSLKPHPSHILAAIRMFNVEPSHTVMVGDHAMDIEVGKKVGCITVGVLSGTGTRETLVGADYLVETISEIPHTLSL